MPGLLLLPEQNVILILLVSTLRRCIVMLAGWPGLRREPQGSFLMLRSPESVPTPRRDPGCPPHPPQLPPLLLLCPGQSWGLAGCIS